MKNRSNDTSVNDTNVNNTSVNKSLMLIICLVCIGITHIRAQAEHETLLTKADISRINNKLRKSSDTLKLSSGTTTKKGVIKRLVTRVAGGIKYAFKTTDSFVTFVLTKQGMMKTLVYASPFIALYCINKDINPLKMCAASLIKSIAKARKFYEIQVELGNTEAFIDVIKNQPKESLILAAWNVLGKLIKSGVPYVTGLYVKKAIEKPTIVKA